VGQNHSIRIANKSFENMGQFRYLGMKVRNQNLIQEEISNACCHSVQNLLSSCLLSKNVNIRIYKTIIKPGILCVCESWSLTLRDDHRLRVFKDTVLRRIFGLKRDEVIRGWRKLHNEELHNL
jgi:hypothetical protein